MKAKKLTAANCPFLANVKRAMNKLVFARCSKIANDQGLKAAQEYIGQCFREEVRDRVIEELMQGEIRNRVIPV